MAVIIRQHGNFENTKSFLKNAKELRLEAILQGCGDWGVQALAAATPVDTGLTAASWGYNIVKKDGSYTIEWTNNNTNQGFSIALGKQYGHATGTGGWVEGQDYINPAMKPVFDKITEQVFVEVAKL